MTVILIFSKIRV